MGNTLDLRELQKTGRIGRIKVNVNSVNGKSSGMVIIPSSLDKSHTAIIAAALETIDRVGPCEAKISIDSIMDVRDTKRKFIVDRASQILEKLEGAAPDKDKLSKMIEGYDHPAEKIKEYKELPAGPAMLDSDAIIVVEGRADVINLLRHGIRNTVAIEGTSVPDPVKELTRQKETVTAFLDGDRGGDLILKELKQVAKIDFVARAPVGKYVEKLERDDIQEALKNKVPADKAKNSSQRKNKRTRDSSTKSDSRSQEKSKPKEELDNKEDLRKLEAAASGLAGTSNALLLDRDLNKTGEVKVRELADKITEAENVWAVVFDGVVSQRLADVASQRKIKYLIGARESVEEKPRGVRIITINNIRKLAR